MSNIQNLSSRIAKLSRELTQARHDADEDLIADIEDELFELEEQLADATESENDHSTGWH